MARLEVRGLNRISAALFSSRKNDLASKYTANNLLTASIVPADNGHRPQLGQLVVLDNVDEVKWQQGL
jgi:hypothetical protein